MPSCLVDHKIPACLMMFEEMEEQLHGPTVVVDISNDLGRHNE